MSNSSTPTEQTYWWYDHAGIMHAVMELDGAGDTYCGRPVLVPPHGYQPGRTSACADCMLVALTRQRNQTRRPT